MLHVGMDLSRTRLDVHVMNDAGESLEVSAWPPDRDGLRHLVAHVQERYTRQEVMAVIESMNGARFVHDTLEIAGWAVEIADAQKVKGLAPLACKTDKIDARVLAELSRRDLVPAIWLPGPEVRSARERARWRLHLVRHRTALKNRIHATLLAFGHPCPVSDLFGTAGLALLGRLQLPEPWSSDVKAALRLIDTLDGEIEEIEADLRHLGAKHAYVPLLMTVPGIGWILAYTIACELGDIDRFSSPKKLCGYTGLCPRVYQSGGTDHRGPLTKNGPRYLRWALIEAATHAARHPIYKEHYERTARRLGRQRGKKVARVELARTLAEAIFHMLAKNEPFAPHLESSSNRTAA
jgi:transposase